MPHLRRDHARTTDEETPLQEGTGGTEMSCWTFDIAGHTFSQCENGITSLVIDNASYVVSNYHEVVVESMIGGLIIGWITAFCVYMMLRRRP
jgi:hypothetical protein